MNGLKIIKELEAYLQEQIDDAWIQAREKGEKIPLLREVKTNNSNFVEKYWIIKDVKNQLKEILENESERYN